MGRVIECKVCGYAVEVEAEIPERRPACGTPSNISQATVDFGTRILAKGKALGLEPPSWRELEDIVDQGPDIRRASEDDVEEG